jgi:hypothetical protein
MWNTTHTPAWSIAATLVTTRGCVMSALWLTLGSLGPIFGSIKSDAPSDVAQINAIP